MSFFIYNPNKKFIKKLINYFSYFSYVFKCCYELCLFLWKKAVDSQYNSIFSLFCHTSEHIDYDNNLPMNEEIIPAHSKICQTFVTLIFEMRL